jgi:hypothetical protein
VHVHVPARRAAGDDERVAELVEAVAQGGDGLLGRVEQERDLVAERRVLTGNGDSWPMQGLGQRKQASGAAADGRVQRVEQHAQPGAAGVDHAAGRQHLELPPRAEECFAGGTSGRPADLGQVALAGGRSPGGAGCRVRDRQHGALDRAVHGRSGQRGGPGQSERDHLPVAGRRGAAGVGEPAEQLAEDDAGVPAGSLQRGRGGRLPDLGGAGLVRQASQRAGGACDRLVHVRAGIGIGDREHVEHIDRGAFPAELGGGEAQPGPHHRAVDVLHCRHVRQATSQGPWSDTPWLDTPWLEILSAVCRQRDRGRVARSEPVGYP